MPVITVLTVSPFPMGESRQWKTDFHFKDYAEFIQYTADIQYRVMPDGTRRSVGSLIKLSPTYYAFIYTEPVNQEETQP